MLKLQNDRDFRYLPHINRQFALQNDTFMGLEDAVGNLMRI